MADKKVTIYDVFEALMACFRAITRPIWLTSDNSLRVSLNGWIYTWSYSNILNKYSGASSLYIDNKQTLVYATDRMSWGLRVRSKIT